jgi:hypothetical protein
MNWAKRNLQFPSTPWFAKKKGQSKKQTRLGDRHATRQSAMERGKSCFPMSNVTRNDDACAGRQDEAGDVRSILHIKTIHIRPSVRPSTFNTTVLGPSTPQGLAGVACQKNPMSQPHRSTADDDYGTHRRKPVPHNFVGSYSSLPRRLCGTLFILLLIRLTNDNNKRIKRALFIIKNKRSTFLKKWGGLQPHLNMRRWM